jgi:serine protease SohB
MEPNIANIAHSLGAWSQIGVFAAEAFLIVIAIAFIAILIAVLSSKANHKSELEITPLHEKFKHYAQGLQEHILEKDELKAEKKKQKELEKKTPLKKKLYFIKFEGDTKATGVEQLREEISAVLTVATPEDEVVVSVESPGGMVHGYGLAASQLARLRNHKIPLTVCVDKVAASGGYLMSCVADKILAAPFAIVGSIGVVAQVPNFHRLLKKNDIDYQEYTAGEFKRTISLLGEITPKGEEKFRQELEETHVLFKNFVSQFRPKLDIQKIATGEHWYGEQAIKLNLVDEIQTSDDYLLNFSKTHSVFQVKFSKHQSLQDKISDALGKSAVKAFENIWARLQVQKWF